MKFHKLTDTCKPEPNRDVIIRIARAYSPFGDKVLPIAPYLYIVVRQDYKDSITVYDDGPDFNEIRHDYHDIYTEACGEQYTTWLDCEISHWCYASDILEEIEENL